MTADRTGPRSPARRRSRGATDVRARHRCANAHSIGPARGHRSVEHPARREFFQSPRRRSQPVVAVSGASSNRPKRSQSEDGNLLDAWLLRPSAAAGRPIGRCCGGATPGLLQERLATCRDSLLEDLTVPRTLSTMPDPQEPTERSMPPTAMHKRLLKATKILLWGSMVLSVVAATFSFALAAPFAVSAGTSAAALFQSACVAIFERTLSVTA